MTKFHDVHKGSSNLEVLKGIDLNIEKGQVVTPIGPSRSGRSTILRYINLLEEPTRDQVPIDNVDITVPKVDIQTVRKNIDMVFQHSNLSPHMTIMESMTCAPVKVNEIPKDKTAENALEFLKLVDLVGGTDAYPGKLSGDQKQRITVARALATELQITLFDEPTSTLDPEMVKEVLEATKNPAHTGITMALVTHEVRSAREVSDRICFTGGGQIVENANPGEFFKNPKSDGAGGSLKKVLQRKHG